MKLQSVPYAPALITPAASESAAGDLQRRIRRIGSFAAGIGLVATLLCVGIIITAGPSAGDVVFAFHSEIIGLSMYYGVPMLLVACLVPLSTTGDRLRLSSHPAESTRTTLARM